MSNLYNLGTNTRNANWNTLQYNLFYLYNQNVWIQIVISDQIFHKSNRKTEYFHIISVIVGDRVVKPKHQTVSELASTLGAFDFYPNK